MRNLIGLESLFFNTVGYLLCTTDRKSGWGETPLVHTNVKNNAVMPFGMLICLVKYSLMTFVIPNSDQLLISLL